MPKPKVSIIRVKDEDVHKSVQEAVNLAGGLGGIVSDDDTVLIKPNAKNTTPQGLGVNTDLRVVEATLNIVQSLGAGKVIIAEGAAYPSGDWDTLAAFKTAGITELAQRENVEICDLNTATPTVLEITDGIVLKTFTTGKIILDADVIVNLPVIKTHRQTLASICLKNLAVGIARKWEKKALHKAGIDESIVDIYANLRSDFNVVDAIVGVEGEGPNVPEGKPRPLGLILAGSDGLAVDAVGCKIMGIDPQEVPHLRLAAERGLGTIDMEEIDTVGEPLDRVATQFQLPNIEKP